MAKQTPRSKTKHRPEKKIGPFAGGIGVAIWLNSVTTDDGPREIRSLTITPRRYLDKESGEWRDAGSFRPGDLPALIFALQKAQEYVYTTPLPKDGSEQADDEGDGRDISF
ncbi:MAG: hypothetical protein AB7O68_00630 [Pirellulales bacterium]